jgi:hypothetical protein
MDSLTSTIAAQANYSRHKDGPAGFYESFFIRANHPEKPLAFWIRYTIFKPANNPSGALGEVWATWFDGDTGQHVSVKDELPFSECAFNPQAFDVKVGQAALKSGQASGAAGSSDTIQWDLTFSGDREPLLLLPPKLYDLGFPKAKALVSLPLASFSGTLTVNGQAMEIADWVGSQNHNWGVKHTDSYAWGQVAGFDDNDGVDSFLEIATGQLKFGPVWTPRMTLMVLRHQGREYKLNSIRQSLKAYGRFEFFTWTFKSATNEIEIEGTISASKKDFVGLQYYNPPGGIKHCLNTKIATCQLSVLFKETGEKQKLTTRSRAAFEILTDDHHGHGVKLYA